MIYLFDTNTISLMLEQDSEIGSRVLSRYDSLSDDDRAAISVLTLYELDTLAALRPDFSELKSQAIEEMETIHVPKDASFSFARLKIGLARRTGAKISGTTKHNFDLILAATAVHGGYTLVSNDKLFTTLIEIEPALKVEDWTL